MIASIAANSGLEKNFLNFHMLMNCKTQSLRSLQNHLQCPSDMKLLPMLEISFMFWWSITFLSKRYTVYIVFTSAWNDTCKVVSHAMSKSLVYETGSAQTINSQTSLIHVKPMWWLSGLWVKRHWLTLISSMTRTLYQIIRYVLCLLWQSRLVISLQPSRLLCRMFLTAMENFERQTCKNWWFVHNRSWPNIHARSSSSSRSSPTNDRDDRSWQSTWWCKAQTIKMGKLSICDGCNHLLQASAVCILLPYMGFCKEDSAS